MSLSSGTYERPANVYAPRQIIPIGSGRFATTLFTISSCLHAAVTTVWCCQVCLVSHRSRIVAQSRMTIRLLRVRPSLTKWSRKSKWIASSKCTKITKTACTRPSGVLWNRGCSPRWATTVAWSLIKCPRKKNTK